MLFLNFFVKCYNPIIYFYELWPKKRPLKSRCQLEDMQLTTELKGAVETALFILAVVHLKL